MCVDFIYLSCRTDGFSGSTPSPSRSGGVEGWGGGLAAILASAGWHSVEQLACGVTGVSNDPIWPLSYSPGCREGGGGGVLRKHISRGAVPFKPLYQSSSLRSRMMGPKQSTGGGSACRTCESICVAAAMRPRSLLKGGSGPLRLDGAPLIDGRCRISRGRVGDFNGLPAAAARADKQRRGGALDVSGF